MVEYSSPREADDGQDRVRDLESGVAHDYRDDDKRPRVDFEAAVAPEPVGKVAAPVLPPAPPVLAAKSRRGWTRPVLFALLPVALVAGGYAYVTGGQVMSTDNAYVQAQMLGLSTDVSGTVSEIAVHNNQHVAKGQLLFRLRPDSFHIALEGAEAQLGTVRNQVLTLQASYKQSMAQIDQAKADLPFYETSFKRQMDLIATAVASKASFDQAEHDLTSARQRLTVSEAQALSMLAQLGGDANQSVEQNPFYLQAKSLVDNARRDLDDTVVRAPFDGTVTRVDSLQAGAYLKAAQPGFMLVSDTNMWIEASPKETELTWVQPGQKATITVDTYPGVAWQGTVASINPASGGSFSLLPAQNTTGNWVKVVQRIPMRVVVDDMAGKPPLRVGMSVVVDVDTGHARGVPEMLKPITAWLSPWVDRARHFASHRGVTHG
ncbi:HlyD family secretion protein [Lichenihabitans sp. Uapishka_5]|uniref:HlyD family secretion protein n=1 Tax=Lichenihabitans sp. Uapishka_5 TaxID=3037302 RepID=UPI0029E812DF|nr:HlyD family secretion protein [Lichenihabitans sp. Uapishka_5]MDX7949651.1 HlyD family secretion protein [Lichenihabitans sp. Uapishka_5]